MTRFTLDQMNDEEAEKAVEEADKKIEALKRERTQIQTRGVVAAKEEVRVNILYHIICMLILYIALLD